MATPEWSGASAGIVSVLPEAGAWGSGLRSCSIGARVWHITAGSRSIRLRSPSIRLAASMEADPALMYCLAAVMIRPGRRYISAGGADAPPSGANGARNGLNVEDFEAGRGDAGWNVQRTFVNISGEIYNAFSVYFRLWGIGSVWYWNRSCSPVP